MGPGRMHPCVLAVVTARLHLKSFAWSQWLGEVPKDWRKQCHSYPQEWQEGAPRKPKAESAEKVEPVSFPVVPRDRIRGNGHTLKIPPEYQEDFLPCEGDRALAQVAQSGCAITIFGDTEKSPGHGPGHLILGSPPWAGGWTRWYPDFPGNLNHSVNLCYSKVN